MASIYLGNSVYVKKLDSEIKIWIDNETGEYNFIYMNSFVIRQFIKFYNNWENGICPSKRTYLGSGVCAKRYNFGVEIWLEDINGEYNHVVMGNAASKWLIEFCKNKKRSIV